MIHFRKLLFYLFLLIALSAASVVSVLKLSGDKTPIGIGNERSVQKVANSVEDTAVDPLIAPDVKITVASSSVKSENEDGAKVDSIDMETVGDQILADESIDLEDETNSDFDFIAVSATRTEEDAEIVSDDNEIADAIVADEIVFEDDVDEITGEAQESLQGVAYADGFDGDDDWVVFDENADSDESVETADDDTLDSIFDEDSDDEIVFDSNDSPLEDENESETASSDEIVFDDNEIDEEDSTDTLEKDASSVADDESSVEETDDSLSDFLSALETSDVEDEIVFEDNDVDEEETVENAENVKHDEEILDVELDDAEETREADVRTIESVDDKEEKGGSQSKSGKVLFKSNSAKSLPDFEALEQEAGFFNESLPAKDGDGEKTASGLLETGKTDDAYTSEIVYDSNDDAESGAETPNASDDSASSDSEEKSDDSVSGDSDDEREESNESAEPCGPVVLCLAVDDEETNEAAADAKKVETQSSETGNRYRRAPTTIRVSSQTVVDKVSATSTAAPIQDEIWIISQGGSYWLFENGSWNQKEPKSFFSDDDPRRVSIIWAHGYQTDMSSASRSGFNLKAVVDAARAATGIDRKYRIVIWKWESERNNTRLRLDAREKKDLAYYSGTKLGKFVGCMNPKDDVVFVGFSFGALVTGSALQTLATTSNRYMAGHKRTAFATSGVDAQTTPETASGRISLILVSAACDLGSFNQGGIFQLGAELPTRVLNVYNPTDYALKFYPLISGTSQAVGIAPLMGNEFVNAIGETFNLNANSYLGKEHSFDDAIEYVSATTLSDMIF